ncbi:isochorismatase family cysteine hydrolase [Duganella aceris]|uniref:Cysteine hydrolase n=1 Tax=Duganella aceris TaxID=2703883 RepID=A0ABX0FPC3_9BURK|nr:isochorismatase family cysteine hydrolase [Duganella aceris]NGZ86338.1 cysteine hydrolase [Duganella aceris]
MAHPQYPTSTSALLLVDVLNDFLAPDGKVHANIRDQIEQVGLVANLTRLIEGARAAGLQIAYAPHGLHEHSFDDVKYVPVRMQYAMEHHVFWEGEKGSDFFELFRPQDGDIVSSRHRTFNGFMGTDLDARLKARGIEKLIFAGLTSQTCVEGTARHATEAGYHVTFLTDAVAEFTPEAHKAALEISYPTFGHEVLTVDQVLAAIS